MCTKIQVVRAEQSVIRGAAVSCADESVKLTAFETLYRGNMAGLPLAQLCHHMCSPLRQTPFQVQLRRFFFFLTFFSDFESV